MDDAVPAELIDAARRGAAADIERLLEKVWPDAYRLARGIVPTAQGAEDVAQEACVRIFRNIGSLRDANAFRTWFYRIVVREALRHKAQHSSTTIALEAVHTEDRLPNCLCPGPLS